VDICVLIGIHLIMRTRPAKNAPVIWTVGPSCRDQDSVWRCRDSRKLRNGLASSPKWLGRQDLRAAVLLALGCEL